jgi:hypothetical protein
VREGREPMGDGNDRLARHGLPHARLDERLLARARAERIMAIDGLSGSMAARP